MSGGGVFGGLRGGGQAQQQQMQAQAMNAQFLDMINNMQVQDSVRMFNRVTEHCFQGCIDSYHSKSLDGGESKCIDVCAQKFLKLTQRVGQRFQEHQAQQEQQSAQQQAAGAQPAQQQ